MIFFGFWGFDKVTLLMGALALPRLCQAKKNDSLNVLIAPSAYSLCRIRIPLLF